ncbi:MAG: hypothetical protein ABL901_04685 [Hyphomicrobiaceae bacterium]
MSQETLKPFYVIVSFWLSLGLSLSSFTLFVYLALADSFMRQREANRSRGYHESVGAAGDLAEKFSRAGFASSALAYSVVFALLATSIALALDKLSILPIAIGAVAGKL